MARGKPPATAGSVRLQQEKPQPKVPVPAPTFELTLDGPVSYSEQLVDYICSRVAGGETLEKILADPGMPCRKAFYLWRKDHPEAQAAFLAAMEVKAERYVEETVQISDEVVRSSEEVSRNKLRVQTRQWYAERTLAQYVPKVGIGGAPGLPPVKHQVDVDITLTPAEAYKRMSRGG